MFPYIGLFAYASIGAALNTSGGAGLRRGALWITGIILIVMIGFRWEVGADWLNYEHMLYYTRNGSYGSAIISPEPGYNLLNSIAAYADWGIWFPNLICAIIFVYGLLAFCREQPSPWLALVVAVPYLVIDVAMGYTRQGAAVGLVMLALGQFMRGSYVRMFVSLAFAATFHASAIVVAPLFALAIVTRPLFSVVILGFFGMALYFAFSDRVGHLMNLYQEYKITSAGAIPRILMNVFAAGVFLFWRRHFSENSEVRRLWTIFSLVALLALPMVFIVKSTTVVDRLVVFLVPLQMFVLSRLPLLFGDRRRQNVLLLSMVVVYSLAAELVWLNFGNEARHWIPYKNFLWESAFE